MTETSKPQFKIESGVPIPKKRGRPRDSKYPFAALGRDQSFFVGCKTKEIQRICSACSWAGKRYGMKFISRAVDGGVRVWRVE